MQPNIKISRIYGAASASLQIMQEHGSKAKSAHAAFLQFEWIFIQG